jgi:hypothetical protein
MRIRLRHIAIILVAATALGLGWNALSSRGPALTRNAYVREGDELVEAAQARARLDKGALFLDARPVAFYEMSHIPGALPLPEDDFDLAFAKIEPRLRSSFDIIVYCSGFGCEASHWMVSIALGASIGIGWPVPPPRSASSPPMRWPSSFPGWRRSSVFSS